MQLYLIISLLISIVNGHIVISFQHSTENDSHVSKYNEKLIDQKIKTAAKNELHLISNKGITVITRRGCGWSLKALDYLKKNNIKFEHIIAEDTDDNSSLMKVMRRLNQTFPRIYIDGEFIGGFSEAVENPYFNKLVRGENPSLLIK